MPILVKLLALGLTALILVPSGAHLFELPAKIALESEQYFTVQQIYAGWALFAAPILAAIAANGWLFLALRRREAAGARAALVSAGLIAASLVVFFIWIYPANQATANWTQIPADWQGLRRNWEYGHAANAVIVFLALLCTGRAVAAR